MSFGFETEVTEYVDVFCEDEFLIRGELTFGKSRGVSVFFANDFENLAKLHGEKFFDRLILKRSDGVYTILKCKVDSWCIFAKAIVKGHYPSDGVSELTVRYNVVSRWFNNRNEARVDCGDDDYSVTWGVNKNHFQARVVDVRNTFSIQSHSEASCRRVGEDFVIHEHVVFCIRPMECTFSIEEFIEKTHELLVFFTIIIGLPVDVNSVRFQTESGVVKEAYFPTFKINSDTECEENVGVCAFLRINDVEEQWGSVVNRYFSSSLMVRRDLWLRLSGMKSYKGFWEYEVLGYFFLLESYVDSVFAKDTKTNRGRPKNAEIKDEMRAYAKNLPAEYKRQVIEFADKIRAKDNDPTFMDKYRHAVGLLNQDVAEIIDLSETDVVFMKDLRDSIAHGDRHNLADGDFKVMGIVLNKVIALLTCWAYEDFGLERGAIKFLLCSRHKVIDKARLNVEAKDRISGQARFIDVSAEDFNSSTTTDSVFEDDGSGWVLSERLANYLVEWRGLCKKGGVDWMGAFLDEEEVVACEMAFSGLVYLKCVEDGQEKKKRLAHAYLVKVDRQQQSEMD